MSLEINLEPNISINDMQSAMEQGVSVLRSAHVGNLRAYNLALAEAGIPMLLVDHNIVCQQPGQAGDKNYFPGAVITRESITPLRVNQIGGMSLKTSVLCPETDQEMYVDEFHIRSLQKAFPQTDIFSNTDYLRTQESKVQEMVGIFANDFPELFTRFTEDDGTIQRADKGRSFAHFVGKHGILQLNDDPRTERGVLMPNDADIIVNFVIEALRSDMDTQIHISGPAMKIYTQTKEAKARLANMYESVRQRASFGKELPEDLTVRLVPADHAVFATTNERAYALQTVFDKLRELDGQDSARNEFFKSSYAQDPDAKATFIANANETKQIINTEIREALEAEQGIFASSDSAPYVSQYDVIEQDGLYVADENRSLTMEQLRQLANRLQKIRGKPQ